MQQYVIVYGSIFEGLQGAVGPFASQEEAEDYCELHNLGHFERAPMFLDPPEEENDDLS